uniref:Uncharacterized protein n=1 Tax=Melopsittacus undulatus TaxID=13146 RepID=A0A8C6JAP5_MELUD
MKVYSIFRSGHFLVLLCLFTVEGKKSPTVKHTCRKGLLLQVTENLYIKATSLKSSVPKDLIKNTRLLKKTTKTLFMVRLTLLPTQKSLVFSCEGHYIYESHMLNEVLHSECYLHPIERDIPL